MPTPRTILFAGPSGAGKSTVAKVIAELLPKSALIQVDQLRAMPVNGWLDPLETTPESSQQMMLAVRNACALAGNFIHEGFTPIIDDVLSSKERLDTYLVRLEPFNPIVFLLLPDRDTITTRDAQREPAFRVGQRALELHTILQARNQEEHRWTHIDSTHHTVTQTVMELVQHLQQRNVPLVPDALERLAHLKSIQDLTSGDLAKEAALRIRAATTQNPPQ